MGIKFRCPNGHKLHVKSFLAGKKGVCPKCGVKVDVPLASMADEPDDAPSPAGGIQLGYAPAVSLFPIPAPPPGVTPTFEVPAAPPQAYAPPLAYAPPQAYAPSHGYAPPAEPFGFPPAAMPQPAAPVPAGQPRRARPIPIPAPGPSPFPVPAPPSGAAAPMPAAAPLAAKFPAAAAPAGPLPVPPLPAANDDPFAGLLPPGGEGQWDPNMALAGPAAVPAAPPPHVAPAKRGGLNLGRNGTLLLVFVALVLVGALVWGVLHAGN